MNRNKVYNEAEQRAVQLVFKVLSKHYKYIKKIAIDQSPEGALVSLSNISLYDYSDLLAEIYKTEGATFFLFQQAELLKYKREFVRTDFEVGFWSEIWKQAMKGVMSNLAIVERVTGISDTTKKRLRQLLSVAVENRMGSREIARLFNSEIPILKGRSLTIARTETTYAASLGASGAANNSTLPLLKVWVSAKDERTRPDHLEANNSRVKKNEKFLIGGQEMEYPGDPNGGASQVVNCRCGVAYIVDEANL
jgi:hypothetical protein